jgi:benzoyl-CoA reductase/2-hydroxyglutaryl-CoA dehydratase subunit BcrC/BadD/HgdB
MRTMVRKIEEIAGFAITDDMLREMMAAKDKVGQAIQKVRSLVETSDPMPLNPAHENIWITLNSLTLDLNGYAEALEAMNLIYEELKEKVAKGEGVTEKGAPRVLAVLPAGEGDPRMEHLATELGIAIVAVNTPISVPFVVKTDDPYLKLSFAMQNGSLGTNLAKKIELIIDACRRLKVDGVLNRYHVGCRQVAGDCMLIEQAIKKELNIPTMLWEWENFDPREYQHEEYKRRFEIFKAMMTAQSS